jgi:hypothetical protein
MFCLLYFPTEPGFRQQIVKPDRYQQASFDPVFTVAVFQVDAYQSAVTRFLLFAECFTSQGSLLWVDNDAGDDSRPPPTIEEHE